MQKKLTTAERFMIEEFDYRYRNVCALRIALRGYPEFEELRSVTAFEEEAKIRYMKIIRFLDEYLAYKHAHAVGLVPYINFDDPFGDDYVDVPYYIDRDKLLAINI